MKIGLIQTQERKTGEGIDLQKGDTAAQGIEQGKGLGHHYPAPPAVSWNGFPTPKAHRENPLQLRLPKQPAGEEGYQWHEGHMEESRILIRDLSS